MQITGYLNIYMYSTYLFINLSLAFFSISFSARKSSTISCSSTTALFNTVLLWS